MTVRELNTKMSFGMALLAEGRANCRNFEARAFFTSRSNCTEARATYAEKTRGRLEIRYNIHNRGLKTDRAL